MAQHYRCNICQEEFPATQIEVDHLIGMAGAETWDDYIDKLYCEKEWLQAVCKPCHRKKTAEERKK